MLTVDIRRGEQKSQRHTDLDSIGEWLDDPQALFWIDMTDPTDTEWDTIAARFKFHPLALEDARQRNQRPKLDAYDGYLYLALRAWIGEQSPSDDRGDATQEVDVFFAPRYLITIHEGGCDPLKEVRRRWDALPTLPSPPGQGAPQRTSALLLHTLLDTIVDAMFPVMDQIDEAIDTLETQVYTVSVAATAAASSREPLELAPALRFKKKLLLLRQTVAPLRDILNELLRTGEPLVPGETTAYFQDVYDHTLRLLEQIDLHRDIVGGVMDAVMAQTNNRLNQVVKTLTVFSTMLMSASLVAGIYGMNFKYMPELEWRYGYFGALALMLGIIAALALYFKRIGWF
ncbi:MAG: magnesium/cobalt transporter CorA [Cytophagales bacterium]|nr:magnesium/cobalt transporter CorA [Armatimonadota bacterium]